MKQSLSRFFTDVGGSLPAVGDRIRGVIAIKRAAATEDEVHIGLHDSSGVHQWRRLLTQTYGDTLYSATAHNHAATYVDVAGDTMTGALVIDLDSTAALNVTKADNTKVLTIDTTNKQVEIRNATDLIIYSDDGTTVQWTIDGATGQIETLQGGSFLLSGDNGGTTRIILNGANGNITAVGQLTIGAGSAEIISGTGSPEGVHSAPIGSLFLRTDGGAGTSLYVKQSGTGNTGWAGK